jgi:hypothetical protein
MDDPVLARLVEALRPVAGLAALVLGGARGRGTAGPASDHGLGLCYEPDAPPDPEALRAAVAPLVDGPSATVTRIGAWGPWINGGGWLGVGGVEVDLLCRDLGRPRAVIADARAGRFPITVEGLAAAELGIWEDIGDGDHERALRRLRGLSDGLRAVVLQR